MVWYSLQYFTSLENYLSLFMQRCFCFRSDQSIHDPHCEFLSLPYLSDLSAAASEDATLDNAKNEVATPKMFPAQMGGDNAQEVQRGRHVRSASVGREARSTGTLREGGREDLFSFVRYCTILYSTLLYSTPVVQYNTILYSTYIS